MHGICEVEGIDILSEGAELTAVSTEEEASLGEMVRAYQMLLEREVDTNWGKGDIAEEITREHEARKKLDPKADLLGAFLFRTGENRTSFNNHRWIARTYQDPEVRALPLSWTHFRIAAGTTEPEKNLRQAYEEAWTTRRLLNEVFSKQAITAAASGIPCGCGCALPLPETGAIFVGGGPERKRRFFATLPCMLSYYEASLSSVDRQPDILDQMIVSGADIYE